MLAQLRSLAGAPSSLLLKRSRYLAGLEFAQRVGLSSRRTSVPATAKADRAANDVNNPRAAKQEQQESKTAGRTAGAELQLQTQKQSHHLQQDREEMTGQRHGNPNTDLKQPGKKGRELPPQALYARQVYQCAKNKDVHTAIQIFQTAQAQSVSLPLDALNSLLYLVVGGDAWEALARGGDPDKAAAENIRTASPQLSSVFVLEPPAAQEAAAAAAPAPAPAANQVAAKQKSRWEPQQEPQAVVGEGVDVTPVPVPMTREERVRWAEQLWTAMQAANIQPDATSYLALARLEGLGHNPDKALHWVKAALDARCAVTIRMFHPAMVGYCMQRNSQALLEVEQLIAKTDLDLTEYEFARLVEGLASDARSNWETLKGVFLRMGKELEGLSPSTLELARAYFTSSKGLEALTPTTSSTETTNNADLEQETEQPKKKLKTQEAAAEKGSEQPPHAGWQVQTVQVDSAGVHEAVGVPLQVVDLEEAEWVAFAESVAGLARKNEQPSKYRSPDAAKQFDSFISWYDRNGPYDILIDGANVAFFGQNFQGAGFNWPKLIKMVKYIMKAHEGKRVLLMLHQRRVSDKDSNKPEVKEFLDELKKDKAFYATPVGSNDDWYWMYATVRSREAGLLVSNDELRDHIWSLLRPKHFLKWKARHIAHYNITAQEEMTLLYPPQYTTCVQHLVNGAWMFPNAADNTWLCVKPKN